MNTPNKHHVYLHTLLTCALLVQLLDELEGTEYYRNVMKQRAKLLMRSLQPVVNSDMEMLCRATGDGKGITSLMADQEALIKELTLHYTCDMPVTTAVLQMLREDQEMVLQKLDITLVQKQRSSRIDN